MGAQSHEDAVGRVLAGRYRIERLLGRGGMGSVWEAEHTSLGTRVAIKLIRPELADGDTARARFVREARAAANLKSPNVVQIFDYGVDDGAPYIAMELLEGESLADRLRRKGTLSAAETLLVVTHVCRAVAKAHANDIVHRDLKPDNVFVVRDEDGERCKVLDFGIAKGIPRGTLDAKTESGAMLGTPYYMAPEQARDSTRADERSDLWSVAVIAYECLVGERPFESDSLPALSVKILIDPIPIPSEHGDVPAGFDAWFERATKREPTERFQSARALVEALAEAMQLPAPTESMLPPEPVARRRGIAPWIGAIAIASALGAIGWLATRPVHRQPVSEQAKPAAPAKTPVPATASAPAPAPAPDRDTKLAPPTAPPKKKPKPARAKAKPKANVEDLEF